MGFLGQTFERIKGSQIFGRADKKKLNLPIFSIRTKLIILVHEPRIFTTMGQHQLLF